MRLLVLTLFILSFSSFARFEAPPTLTDFLSPQEMKMQECINKINKADEQFLTKANKCLKGSNYYQQRMPSAVNMQMNQMIVSGEAFWEADPKMAPFRHEWRSPNKGWECLTSRIRVGPNPKS